LIKITSWKSELIKLCLASKVATNIQLYITFYTDSNSLHKLFNKIQSDKLPKMGHLLFCLSLELSAFYFILASLLKMVNAIFYTVNG